MRELLADVDEVDLFWRLAALVEADEVAVGKAKGGREVRRRDGEEEKRRGGGEEGSEQGRGAREGKRVKMGSPELVGRWVGG